MGLRDASYLETDTEGFKTLTHVVGFLYARCSWSLLINLIFIMILGVFIFVLYFLPTAVAYSKEKRNKNSVLVINIFLGWTVVGWIVCLAMAISKDAEHKIILNTEERSSVAEQLEKLAKLKKEGFLTEEEFNKEKFQLLEVTQKT